jgi:hypothetical protein
MTAVAFFLRVLFETELNWYYMWPVAAVCLLLATRHGASHLGICSAALFATIVLGNHNHIHNIALWWPGLMMCLVVMLGSTVGRVRLHQTFRFSALKRPARRVGARPISPAGSSDG